jgi:hypothetical protein
VKRIDKLE